MSILAPRSDTLKSFEAARREFYAHLAGGAVFVIGSLLAPKDASADVYTIGLIALFFFGLMTLTWAIATPLESYLRADLELRFEDFGAETRALGHVAVDALRRYLRPLVWLVFAVLILLFLRVLAEWPVGEPLQPLVAVLHWGAWFCALATPVQLFFSTNQLSEVRGLWRSFSSQLARAPFRPRTASDARTRALALAGPAVSISGPYTFSAGGMEWTWSDFQKNAIVFGHTGSGKTVTVLNAFLDGLLSSATGTPGTEAAAALILDPKGDYRDKIAALCHRLGRQEDLVIFDPNRPEDSARWNPFDGPDDALEVGERFAGVLQLQGMKNTQDSFWIDTAKAFLRHAVGFLRATEPPGTPPSFAGINELATNPLNLEARLFMLYAKALLSALPANELRAADLLGEYDLNAMVKEIPRHVRRADAIATYFRFWDSKSPSAKTSIAKEVAALATRLCSAPSPDLADGSETLLASQYLLNMWLPMPERQRGSVQTQLTNMIDPFLGEPYRTVFGERSTITMAEVLDTGKIFYVYMPRDERSAMSRVVNTLIKLDFYRQVLMRRRKTRPSLFLCDEFQSFFSSDDGRGDAPFFERSRESFHANVVATQNLSALLRDVPKEATVHNFMGNCMVKLFLRNTEQKTNEYASDIFGQYYGAITTASQTTGDRMGHGGLRGGASVGTNLDERPFIAAERLSQLAIPDPEQTIPHAEAFLHLGSRAAVVFDRLRFRVHPLEN